MLLHCHCQWRKRQFDNIDPRDAEIMRLKQEKKLEEAKAKEAQGAKAGAAKAK